MLFPPRVLFQSIFYINVELATDTKFVLLVYYHIQSMRNMVHSDCSGRVSFYSIGTNEQFLRAFERAVEVVVQLHIHHGSGHILLSPVSVWAAPLPNNNCTICTRLRSPKVHERLDDTLHRWCMRSHILWYFTCPYEFYVAHRDHQET